MYRYRVMKHRKLVQVICAVLYNCNITGFAKGSIYKGNTKGICVPGLNCYSCPGAVGLARWEACNRRLSPQNISFLITCWGYL